MIGGCTHRLIAPHKWTYPDVLSGCENPTLLSWDMDDQQLAASWSVLAASLEQVLQTVREESMEAEAMDMNVALLPHAISSAAEDGIGQAPAQPGPAACLRPRCHSPRDLPP